MSVRAGAALASAVLVAATGLLVGCGEQPADPAGGPDGSAEGLTPPGSELDIGQTATVPLADESSVVEVTVTDIEAGSPGQAPGLDGTPYFVRVAVTAVSGQASDFRPESQVVGWSGDTQVPPVASPLTIGPCTRTSLRTDVSVGQTWETCVTFVVESGELDRAGFDDDDSYQADQGTAVSWR